MLTKVLRKWELLEDLEAMYLNTQLWLKGSLLYFSLKISGCFCGLLIHFQHHSYVFDYYISWHTLWGWLTNFVKFSDPWSASWLKITPAHLQLRHYTELFIFQQTSAHSVRACNFHCLSVSRKTTTHRNGSEKENTWVWVLGFFPLKCCLGKLYHQFNNWEIPTLVPLHPRAHEWNWRLLHSLVRLSSRKITALLCFLVSQGF